MEQGLLWPGHKGILLVPCPWCAVPPVVWTALPLTLGFCDLFVLCGLLPSSLFLLPAFEFTPDLFALCGLLTSCWCLLPACVFTPAVCLIWWGEAEWEFPYTLKPAWYWPFFNKVRESLVDTSQSFTLPLSRFVFCSEQSNDVDDFRFRPSLPLSEQQEQLSSMKL